MMVQPSGIWRFSIDVGGTFTDVVAATPGGLRTHKLLSSGAVRGEGVVADGGRSVVDPERKEEGPNFWRGYRLRILSPIVSMPQERTVVEFDAAQGALKLDAPVNVSPGCTVQYELRSDEEAPVTAIRYLMGLRLDEPIGAVEVRLGTTLGTNALLERKGARTALITTLGFGDVLKIGYQDRPDLFKLAIRKREEIAERVIEIDERLSATGAVLRAPDPDAVRTQLESAREAGIEALAVCLLHAFVNPVHEELVGDIARSLGFGQVSISSRTTRLERIVPRGDTTVADAYLGKIIRDHVSKLRQSMPQARIRLMTSFGGLIDAGATGGKDTILSGPAGGVIGCAHAARAAGFLRTIGFDMGGTSTDVTRIEAPPDPFEYQEETVKAGIRLMTPMLAVETVAAGGGSICAFDGHMLTVGPHSAGADPGPACYGRGGPLTVTDMNLYLGRVVAGQFPFPLDQEVVETKLAEMSRQLSGAGLPMSPRQLAEGFIEIANAHMSAAIRRISLAKGHDPADYALTTFGGAGGQHACAIAESLGISRVLCSPLAGVLSALGIAVSPIKRIRERSLRLRLCAHSVSQSRAVADEIASELGREIATEGVGPSGLNETQCTLEVCYEGQSSTLPVRAGSAAGILEDFEQRHRRLYGYDHHGRPAEIRAIRVEATAQDRDFDPMEPAAPARGPLICAAVDGVQPAQSHEDRRTHTMILGGTSRRVPLFVRPELTPGMVISGPAVVIEDTSTNVIDRGWTGRVLAGGEILLERSKAALPATPGQSADSRSAPDPSKERIAQGGSSVATSARPSPIRLELFNNQFASIAEQMGVTLRRTALSVNVKERLDFSCAVFTASGDLVVNAPHIPVHLGGMSRCVKCLMEDVGRFEPGDVYITNDPFRGGSHLNDVTVVTPVFDEQNRTIKFFVASRAHHAEIGGTRPGSMPPDSTCLAQEGVLIRAFRLISGGDAHEGELRALLTALPYPSRTPEDNLADIAAQVAANQTGVQALRSMVAQHGLDVVQAYMGYIQAAAEAKMRKALARLPEGIRRFEDQLDDGTTIRLAVELQGGTAMFDFSGTDPAHPGNFNANEAIVTSAVLYCLRCLIDEDIPLNAGVLAPVTIILPTCFLNPAGDHDPLKCPAVASGNVETSQRIVDTIFGALGLAAASQGTMNNLLMGDESFGYYETICGGSGAGPGFHGVDAVHTHMTNTRMTDPETLECRYPVRLRRFQIRSGSGGAGRFRGGCGVVREFEFLKPLDVSIISQRRYFSPYGLDGGGAGQPGRNLLVRSGLNGGEARSQDSEGKRHQNKVELLGPVGSVRVHPGDRLIIETPGGGGWG